MKKIILTIITTIGCILGTFLFAFDSCATENPVTDNYVSIFIDCGGLNSVHTTDGFDLINGEDRGIIGSTVSTVWNMDEDPTSVDQDFLGWYVYDKATGAQIPGTGLLTTAQVNNYIIPNYVIKFVAQWTPRAGYPVKNITFAHFWNGEGEPCYDIRMSIIYGDTVYSGDGFVSIPESLYSTWSGNITYRVEPRNGVYTMYDGKWCNEVCEYEGSVKEFIKQKSVYCSASTTGKGGEKISPRRKVNDWYYQMSFVAPEVSTVSSTAADNVIADTTVVPATYTVETEVYESGASYDAALNAAQTTCGTSNVVVVDINLKDEQGAKVTQLSDYVDVKVDIPATYTIQPGNTVVVYYLNDNGVLEECETVYNDEDPNNRYVTFKTNHFSVYVLVETEIKLIYGPGDFLISEESEEDVNVGESVETDEAENMQQSEAIVSDQTEDISEENPDDDKASTDNSSDNSNTPLIWIVVGLAALVVVLVFIFVKKKEFLKK